MLGEIVNTEIGNHLSTDIMKDLNDRIRNFSVNKNSKQWRQYAFNILSNNDSPYMFMEKEYKITFGEVRHANGIGNNNEWPIFLVSNSEKCLVGYYAVLWPIYGSMCKAWLLNTRKEKIEC